MRETCFLIKISDKENDYPVQNDDDERRDRRGVTVSGNHRRVDWIDVVVVKDLHRERNISKNSLLWLVEIESLEANYCRTERLRVFLLRRTWARLFSLPYWCITDEFQGIQFPGEGIAWRTIDSIMIRDIDPHKHFILSRNSSVYLIYLHAAQVANSSSSD